MEGKKKDQTNLPPNPQKSANILSRLTISWTIGIFKKGAKNELQVSDLYAPLEEYRSSELGNKLDRYWQSELGRAKLKARSPSLIKAIFRCFGLNMLFYGILMFSGEVLFRITQPLLLAQMLRYFSPGSAMSRSEACCYAAGVVFCTGTSVVINNPVWLGSLMLAMKLRVACCSVIYRKSLRLSQAALGQATVGQAVNLMANDVNRFDAGIVYMHFLWIGPATTVAVTYFLWLEVGVGALVGVAALLVSVPMQIWLGKQKSIYRLKTALRTDERIRLMNEIINGISVIKMYTWEKPFEKLVSEARRLEIKEIRGSSYITGILLSFLLFNNHLAIFCSLVTYVYMGNSLTASIAYVVTAYFILIRNMMSEFFPFAIGTTAELLVSIKRIETFMLNEEITKQPFSEQKEKDNLDYKSFLTSDIKNYIPEIIECHKSGSQGVAVALNNVTASWSKQISEETLKNINIDFRSGELSLIIGPVGSGKSSVLHAIMGELPVTCGTLNVSGTLSYAAQEPWLFEGSVRQNILFGCPYDEARYHRVVWACALTPDLQRLPYGDLTLVGDRGTILSGGQRARINMARAVYRDCDIYLLDNPLAAVDTHVARHLFEKCISGFLKGRTVILVTHLLQYLNLSDHIVLLHDGKVKNQGTFEALKQSSTPGDLLFDQENEESKATTTEHTVLQKAPSEPEATQQVAVDETRTEGCVTGEVFYSYLSAGGHWVVMLLMLSMFCLTQLAVNAQDYWLNHWVNLEEYVYNQNNSSLSTSSPEFLFHLSQNTCIVVFTILILSTVVLSFTRSFFFVYMCMRSSTWLHQSLFSAITRANMAFFHTNPSGRILNRFSKDMGAVDELLPTSLLHVLQIGLAVCGIVLVLALINVWLLIPTSVVAFVFYFLRKFYLKTSRAIKRVEGITRSPVFSHLNASLQGLSTIRAFRAEPILEKEFDEHQDLHSSAFHIFAATAQAFGYWLDIVCFIYVSIVTFSFFVLDQSWLGGSVGLAVTQTIAIVGIFQFGMRQSADLENFMTSVERILEYTEVKQEPPLESLSDLKPPVDWPRKGEIEFRKVVMSYKSSLPPALKNLSFTILPKEKVGIVGRTGAGKSSLTTALFHLSPLQGEIFIDNVDVTNLGLHDLRSKISIIPQEPVLFSGTVRKNLDPFDEYSDSMLWSALEEVELKVLIDCKQDGLNSIINDGGSNLSVGQRQLMCLARAIVRNNRILVLDEATANVDHETDALIQSTIRRKFAHCTVLTIAHRLNTVADCDKILVMSDGSMVEFDHPYKLLANKDGYFYKMVEELGRASAESLHNIATKNYNKYQPEGL